MRILFCITECVVHTVKNSICAGIQKRRTLKNVSKNIKHALPSLAESKHLMGCIPMKKECLEEQRQKPMTEKEYYNDHRIDLGKMGKVWILIDLDLIK